MTTDTIVIGAGPAGLAVAACLRERAVPFVLLEQAERVGASWRGHYDRLHLHTDRGHSGLPHRPMPADYPRYPSRDQVVAYLEDYAGHFDLQPRFGEPVQRAHREDGAWTAETPESTYRAAHLVVATGHARVPYRPTWPGQDDYAGEVLHSSAYRDGAPYRGQRVLVVGFGNSAGEIALDLVEHGASPALAVRGPVNVIPRDLLGLPILTVAGAMSGLPPEVGDRLIAPVLRLRFGDLRRHGLRKAPYGPRTQVVRHGRIPLIDIGTVGAIQRGRIGVRPGVARFTGTGVVFDDGREEDYDAVVLGTGYRPQVADFLEAPDALDARGAPAASGVEPAAPGLWFCGFHISPGGMLQAIRQEAPAIADAIRSASARA